MATLTAGFDVRRKGSGPEAIALYCAFVFGAVALYWPTVTGMWAQWLHSSSYSHGTVIAPLALIMLLHQRTRAPARFSTSASGLVFTAFATALWLAGYASGVAPVEQIGFISILIGGFWSILGDGAVKAHAFPLAFLYFMAPLGESLVPALQFITAQSVVRLLALFGLPVSLNGVVIMTPAGAFAIAEACAGLRYLLSAIVVAAVFSYMSFRSWPKRLAFIAIAAAVAIIANLLRALFVILIATLTDMQVGFGPDHLVIGLIFYAAIFIVLFWIAGRMGEKRLSSLFAAPPSANASWSRATALAALIMLVAGPVYADIVIDRPPAAPPRPLTYINAPGWRIMSPPENWSASAQTADQTLDATYASDEGVVYVSLSQFTFDRRGAEITSAAIDTDRDGWRFSGTRKSVVFLFGLSEPVPVSIFAGDDYRRVAAVTAFWSGEKVFANRRELKRHQLREKLAGRNPPGGAITIAAAYRRDPDEAIRTIRTFTVSTETFRAWRARSLAG